MDARRLAATDASLACELICRVKLGGMGEISVGQMEGFLSRRENVLVAGWADDEPIGFLLAYVLERIDMQRPMVCIYEIEVIEAYRRRGGGRAMVEVLKEVSREAGATKVWTITDRANDAAMKFFERVGSEPCAGADAVVFTYHADT